MVDKARRRTLVDAYKERRPRRGVYAIRCLPTGELWVSASRNLEAQQTQAWFTLRQGSYMNRALQASWTTHGEDAFSFEILAELPDDDASAYAVAADLKALETSWRKRLGASKATG
jgi:hypothetical protein